MKRLENKVAVVAGAATGIGAACARRFVEEGAKVIIGDLNIDTANQLADELGNAAIAVKYDAADEASIKHLIDSAVDKFGALHVLHNNVALTSKVAQTTDLNVTDISLSTWEDIMRVNTTSFLIGTKYAVPHMIASGGGAIVNTASNSGRFGDVVRTAYGASKAAVISLTQHIAVQYGKQGIRCNAIAPGVILTDAMKSLPELVTLIEPHIVTPEFGEPHDVAALAAFLASDESRYITGQVIPIDGGASIHHPQLADIMRNSETKGLS
ncbi:MAG: short-chain dehydrogenase [Porticoccaceae bacterium]|nr:short-chain dehydrogenase [Porticoccaceae bacterium]